MRHSRASEYLPPQDPSDALADNEESCARRWSMKTKARARAGTSELHQVDMPRASTAERQALLLWPLQSKQVDQYLGLLVSDGRSASPEVTV